MIRIFNTLLSLCLASIMTGCFISNEEIWIESDGSGRMETVTDLSTMYPVMKYSLDLDSKDKQNINGDEDRFVLFMENMIATKKLDSTYLFKDVLLEAIGYENLDWAQMIDSLRSEVEASKIDEEMFYAIEDMAKTKMRWQIDESKDQFITTNMEEIQNFEKFESCAGKFMDIMGRIENAEKKKSATNEFLIGIFSVNTSLNLSGNTLNISRAPININSSAEENKENFAILKLMMGAAKYRLTIHFPGKVKKISSDQVKIIDKTSIVIEIPFEDIFNPNKSIDVDVEFKGLKK